MNGLLSTYNPGLGIFAPALPAAPPKWIAVQPRFEQFHRNLALTPLQQTDGIIKRNGVIRCLNRAYYGSASDVENSFFVGSWGKNTAIRPPRDIDLYFLLPPAVYQRFQGYASNRQSALLQEVKNLLAVPYPDTDMRGDGQVVVVRFDSYCVEVVPAFALTTGRYWICDTHNGGSYKEADPWMEANHLETVDKNSNYNLLPLVRMLKAWQTWCSVPLKSFQIELIAANFIQQSPWRHCNFLWFDWIMRDFFAYLYSCANSFVFVPGTLEAIWLGDAWQSRTQTAYAHAVNACRYEELNLVDLAGKEWQKIFGQQIPRTL